MPDPLQPAASGRGPLLQRDYWAVFESPNCALPEVMRVLSEHFESFASTTLARFERSSVLGTPLELGEELEVRLKLAGRARICVVHQDALSVTMMTCKGHPEAGRITFGVYPNQTGDFVFHIRSRARARSVALRAVFAAAGDPMQVAAWTRLIDRMAATVAAGVRGSIHVKTRIVEESESDKETIAVEPTFLTVDRRDQGS